MAEVKSALLHVEYGTSADGNECSGVLFEIPTTEVVGGETLEIRLWGMDFLTIAPYALYQGTLSLGSGTNMNMPLGNITESISFGGTSSVLVNWPIQSIVSIQAVSIIYYDNNSVQDIWANVGDDVTSRLTFLGKILTEAVYKELTGVVKIVYTSSQDAEVVVDFTETNKYQAEWPIASIGSVVAATEILTLDDNGAVISYASAGEDITSKFMRLGYSCIKVIDDTKLYGSVYFMYTRSPFYKRWLWPVPVGKGGQYWFFIMRSGFSVNKFSIEVPDLTSGVPEPRNISIRVVDRDSGSPLESASIWIGDIFVGITNIDGVFNIDGIMTGSHPIRVSCAGFTDTDKDTLWNDILTVY